MVFDSNTGQGKVLIWIAIGAIIYYVVKAYKQNLIHKKKNKQHDQWTNDWVYNASARQNNRYEYSDPTWPKDEIKWSPTGWYWDEKKEKWISPDYANAKENTSMPEFRSPEKRERHQQWRKEEGKGPTYEEWKATRLKEQKQKEN